MYNVKDVKTRDALGNPTKVWSNLRAEKARLCARIGSKVKQLRQNHVSILGKTSHLNFS